MIDFRFFTIIFQVNSNITRSGSRKFVYFRSNVTKIYGLEGFFLKKTDKKKPVIITFLTTTKVNVRKVVGKAKSYTKKESVQPPAICQKKRKLTWKCKK